MNILKNSLYIVNPKNIQKIKRDCTFENPTFISNEAQNRSNWNTECYLRLYEVTDQGIKVPRGYLGKFLHDNPNETVSDERTTSNFKFKKEMKINFRSYQKNCLDSIQEDPNGVIVAPTGAGKTILGIELMRRLGQKTLIIVHRSELAKQWAESIKSLLNIDCSFIGGGKWNSNSAVVVAMIQTLSTRIDDIASVDFGTVLVDECHHTPCTMFMRVINSLSAKNRIGLSATLDRSDGLMDVIHLALGPTLHEISRAAVEAEKGTVPAFVYRVKTGIASHENSWASYVTDMCINAKRNQLIFDIANQSENAVLVLTDRVAHAEDLSEFFRQRGLKPVVAHGKLKTKDREEVMKQMRSSEVTVATSSLIGEGIDVSTWATLVLATPISSEIKLMQAIGRSVRKHPGKVRAEIFDLVDDCGFSGASFNKRLSIYQKHKIKVIFK